jgi:hypothetical protein
VKPCKVHGAPTATEPPTCSVCGHRVFPPEVERMAQANAAARELRARVLYDLRGNYATWGMSRAELAALLEGEAGVLRAQDQEDLRRDRGGR